MATMPFTTVNLRVSNVVRHPDAHTAEITVQFSDRKLDWQPADDGKSSTTVILTAVSRSSSEDVLASKVAKFYLEAASQNGDKLAGAKPQITFTLRLPRQTKNIRVALATGDGDRLGAVDLDRRAIDAAPERATPDPNLRSRRPVFRNSGYSKK